MSKISIRFLLITLFLQIVLFSGCNVKTPSQKTEPQVQKYASLSRNSVETVTSKPNLQEITSCTLKLGFSTGIKDPRGEVSELIKVLVEDETGGRIKIQIYPDAQLGSDETMISGLINGDVDIVISSAGNYATYVTQAGFTAMPFLYEDFDQAWEFIDSEENGIINQAFEAYNMHVLGYFDNGFRCVTTSKKAGPIKSVNDMKGLVIRTSSNQIVMETMYNLGAIPKSFPFAKLKTALENEEFMAQENPIPIIYNNGLYEVQKYLAITNHSYDAMPVTIRKDLWEQFSETDKEIIQRAVQKAQVTNRRIVSAQTKNYIEELQKKGMVITYPDLEDFKKATEQVFDVFSTVFGKELMDILE